MEPDLNAFFDQLCSAYGWDWCALSVSPGAAAGIVWGTNPPYTATDFLSFYPKFGATPVAITGSVTGGSTSITSLSSTNGLAANQLITGPDIAAGSIIAGISGNALTLSSAATGTNSSEPLNVYTAPLVPLPMLNTYIGLASASLLQGRWQEMWTVAMGLYVAHFCTLYLMSDGSPVTTAGQAAAQGLAFGVQVSQAAGDVSESMTPVPGLESWGSWNLTAYGNQLATFAKVVGMGPIWIS